MRCIESLSVSFIKMHADPIRMRSSMRWSNVLDYAKQIVVAKMVIDCFIAARNDRINAERILIQRVPVLELCTLIYHKSIEPSLWSSCKGLFFFMYRPFLCVKGAETVDERDKVLVREWGNLCEVCGHSNLRIHEKVRILCHQILYAHVWLKYDFVVSLLKASLK